MDRSPNDLIGFDLRRIDAAAWQGLDIARVVSGVTQYVAQPPDGRARNRRTLRCLHARAPPLVGRRTREVWQRFAYTAPSRKPLTGVSSRAPELPGDVVRAMNDSLIRRLRRGKARQAFRVWRCLSIPEVRMLQPKVVKFGLFALVMLSMGVVIGRFLL